MIFLVNLGYDNCSQDISIFSVSNPTEDVQVMTLHRETHQRSNTIFLFLVWN